MTALSGAVVAASCGGGENSATATTSLTPSMTLQAEAMQPVLDDLREDSSAPGALALVRRGDDEWFGSSGAADLDGSPISATTRFRIGSITKPLTSALVLDAAARGELSLDDTVQSWVPGVIDDVPPVTIRMLLAHTSGIFNAGDEGDVVGDIGRISDSVMREQAQDLGTRYLAGEAVIVPDVVWIAMAETHPLYFEPGSGHHYSNVNYQLAAMALEAATGEDLASLLHERLAAPLGLSSTTTAPDDLDLPDMRSYTMDAASGEVIDTTTDLLAVGNGGSGGVVSTAGELLDLMQAILSGDLLPAPLVAEMTRPTEQSDGTYGLGVVTFDLECGDYWGHAGAIAGMHTLAVVRPDRGEGLVLAVNARGNPEPNLLQAAEELLCASGR
jgi:D-alanyl-D-alanine carboxypeptidase